MAVDLANDGAPTVPPPMALRNILTSITICLLCVGVLAYKNRQPKGIPTDFFAQKLVQPPVYDLVLVGSSRTYRGVDPTQVAKGYLAQTFSRADLTAYNFGFSDMSITPEALSSAEKLLDPEGMRLMLIEVSAPSMEELAPDGFTALHKLKPIELWNLTTFGRYDLLRKLITSSHIEEQAHQNGFVSSDTPLRDPNWYARERAKIFSKPTHSRSVVLDVLKWVARAKERGIKVYTYSPDVPEQTIAQEAREGFKLPDVLGLFAVADIRHLNVKHNYETYDGSHLADDEAARYSFAMGEVLASSESKN